MLRSIYAVAFIAIFLFPSCKKKQEQQEDFSQAKTQYNVAYGSDARQSFNLFLPANRSSSTTKTLLLIHGGAWMAGDKSDWNSIIPTLQTAFPDHAFIAIGYRLYANGQNKFPTQENDVRDCISFIMAHREDYGISDQFAIWGISAGSQLGMLYSYKYGSTLYMPKAMVETVGPTDLLKLYETGGIFDRTTITAIAGDRYSADSMKYITASPLNYVTAAAPPTLILQGDADTLVSWQQALLLHQKLDQFSVTNDYVIYPGQDHSLSGVSYDALIRIQAFLNAHL